MPQGPETLNVSMVTETHPGFSFDDGYRLIGNAVADALLEFGIVASMGAVDGSFCDGTWNVIVDGRKLAGTAQRWRPRETGNLALIHAAILLRPLPWHIWPLLDALDHEFAQPVTPGSHIAFQDLSDADPAMLCDAIARVCNDRLASPSTPLPPKSPQATLAMSCT